MKENLYCVPYDKKVALRKNGISYHCERDTPQEKKTLAFKCSECGKSFETQKGLRIHHSKMKHSNFVSNSSSKRKREGSPLSDNKKNKLFTSI